MGTVGYMAPEQVKGEIADHSCRVPAEPSARHGRGQHHAGEQQTLVFYVRPY